MNTLSNLPFLAMAAFGLYTSHKNKLPNDLLLPYVGLSLIGLGSFLFHLTVGLRCDNSQRECRLTPSLTSPDSAFVSYAIARASDWRGGDRLPEANAPCIVTASSLCCLEQHSVGTFAAE